MAKSKARVLADLLGVNNITESDGTLSFIAGAKGDQGTDGSKGQKGQVGTTGPAGTGSAGSDGADGEKGQKGETGTSGSDGQKGAVGATYYAPDGDKGQKGEVGSSGADGSDGGDGSAGSDGAKGATGTKGATGAKGANGDSGSDGSKGQKGEVGVKGATGSDGDKGDTGAKGTTGNFGGASFKYEFDTATSLTTTLNDGEFRLNNATWGSASTMYISASDVDSNDITDFIESIDDSTSDIKGHVKITLTSDTSEFAMFAIDGSGFESNGVMSIQVDLLSTTRTFSDGDSCRLTFARTGDVGDKGSAGSDGAKGNKGDTGAAGSDGDDGANGQKGETGASGSNGSKGQKGNTGAAGSDGDDGANGQKGETGAAGSNGSKGQKGNTGANGDSGSDGSDGSKGQKGEVGTTGDKGDDGDKGDQGVTGQKGSDGDKGDTGAKGSQGDKGQNGEVGTTGAKGEVGDKGQKGEVGTTGAKGEVGEKGNTGAKGSQGDDGDKGEIGAKGVIGDKGAQGEKGTQGDDGDKGEIGTKGQKGEIGVGEKGATGAKGAQGNKGDQGDVGDDGSDGDKGQKGDSNPNADTLDNLDSTQFLRSDAADSFTGTLTWGGADNGVTSLSLNNSNIRAVNLIEINDPGEGIEFKKAGHPSAGQNTIVHLRAIDSSPYTIMDFDGATELRVGGTRVLTASDSGGYSLQLNQSDVDEDRYYKIAYIPANNGGVYVKGLLGGHETDVNQGSLSLDLAIWARNGDINVQGTISGIGGSSDGGKALFVTKDSSNNAHVWVHTDRYALVNLSYSGVSQSTLYHQPAAVTTEPSDNKVFTTITHDVAAESTVVLNGSLTYKDSSNNISTFGSNHSTNSAIRHTTEHGWMQFGPGNSSWAHIETDRPRFYFNKGITVDTGAISSYNEDLKFERFPGNTTPHLVLGHDITTLATPLTMTTKMESSPTSTIFLDVDGDAVNNTNVNGGGGSVVFNTSATAGTLSQHNASISGLRSGTGDGSSELQFKTTDSSTSATPAMRMIINETGRVGIGVGSPSSKLEVSETMTADAYHYPLTITARDDGNVVNQTNDNSGVGLRFKLAGNASSTPGDSEVGASIVAVRESDTDDNSSSGLAFNISQDDAVLDEAMRIDHVGNVGIGTKSPDEALHVEGSVVVDAYNQSGVAGIFFREGFDSGNNPYNLSITVHDDGDGSADAIDINGYDGIYFNTGDGASRQVRGSVDTSGNWNFHNNTLFVDAGDDRVGIGTNSPDSHLHIKSPGNVGDAGVIIEADADNNFEGDNPYLTLKQDSKLVTADFRLTGDAVAGYGNTNSLLIEAKAAANNASGGSIQLATGGLAEAQTGGPTNGSVRMHIDTNGYVGIGTQQPVQKLQVDGGNIYANGGEFFVNTGKGISAVGDLVFKTYDGTNYQTTMHLDGADNRVGIGTTDPANKLHVTNGSVGNVSGDEITHAEISGGRHHLDFKEIRTATVSDWPATTYKLQMRVDSTNHQSIDFVSDSNSREHIDIKTGNQVFNTRFTYDGKVGIGTNDPKSVLQVQSATGAVGFNYGTSSSPSRGNLWYDTDGTGWGFDIGKVQSDTFTSQVKIKDDGNVGIGTTTPGHKLEVNGSFAATTKSFDIEHPTKDGHRLRYGSLEGPELGVYVRGRSAGGCVELPEHWTGLVDEETITVNLTAIGSAQDLYVEKIENNKVYIHCEGEFFYTIFGERKDVDKLEVEYEHNIQ